MLSQTAAVNYGGHFPAGASFKQVEHYRQVMLTGEFKMFDYDFMEYRNYPKEHKIKKESSKLRTSSSSSDNLQLSTLQTE